MMGSGTSKHVKSISLREPKDVEKADDTSDKNHNRLKTGMIRRGHSQDAVPEENSKDINHASSQSVVGLKGESCRIKELQQQIATVESEKLDLLDRIQLLEERIVDLDTQMLVQGQGDSCQETIHAKNQYITKLEQETTAVQDEVKKLRLKLKRKTKQLSTQVTEAKQEASIRLFELRDEIGRLTEENFRLQEKLRITETPRSARYDVHHKDEAPHDEGRSKLILELSQQMSEQSERIQLLEMQLAEKDRVINDLKRNMEQKPAADDSELLELKAAAEEMKKLERQRKSNRTTDGSTAMTNDASRGSSGQSRDSGVGLLNEPQSKRIPKREATKERPISASSTVSAISITAGDVNDRFGTKVHSAPAGHLRGKPPVARGAPVAMGTSCHQSEADDEWESNAEVSQKSRSGKKKKKFNLKQRLKSGDGDQKPHAPLDAFVSDADLDADLLLESFNQDSIYCFSTNNNTATQLMTGSV